MLPEQKLETVIAKSFKALESALLADSSNPELDPKFYMELPIRVLEALPLEAMEGVDNLMVNCCAVLYYSYLLIISVICCDGIKQRG